MTKLLTRRQRKARQQWRDTLRPIESSAQVTPEVERAIGEALRQMLAADSEAATMQPMLLSEDHNYAAIIPSLLQPKLL